MTGALSNLPSLAGSVFLTTAAGAVASSPSPVRAETKVGNAAQSTARKIASLQNLLVMMSPPLESATVVGVHSYAQVATKCRLVNRNRGLFALFYNFSEKVIATRRPIPVSRDPTTTARLIGQTTNQ